MHTLTYTYRPFRGLASVFTEMADNVLEKDRLKDLRGLTPQQLEYFRTMVEKIVCTPKGGKLDYNVALNLRMM